MHQRGLRILGLIAGGMLLLCLPLFAQVGVETSTTGLDISAKANFERIVVKISGPGDVFLTQEFEPGASLFFNIGTDLPDGSYTYEVTMVPALTADQRDKMAAMRDAGGVPTKAFGGSATSGHFTIENSQIVQGGTEGVPTKDQQILDDLIVDGSICAGQDCVNGESFGFDTIRLKENNLRIKFQDTSNSASFPSNDWQLTANDSSNGGANKFSIDDIDGGRTPFTIEASAPSNSLFVEDGGRVGFGTATPVANLHVVEGNTPTLRLEQDGSNGFTPQTWDLAGNEANFFIRDATNGSRLPVQIKPGAPTASIFIAASGDIGIGDASPNAPLNITRTDGSAQLLIQDATNTGNHQMVRLESQGTPRITMVRTGTGAQTWHQQIDGFSELQWIEATTSNSALMRLSTAGNLVVTGTVTAMPGGTNIVFPDYVFETDYELMPLDDLETFVKENKHLPRIPNAESVAEEGINMTMLQIKLVEKVEELTLYTIEQHKTIAELRARLEALEGETTAN